MKFAKIEFNSESDTAKALYGIMQRGRITGLRDGTFIVPEPALTWLDTEEIPYKIVQKLNHDDVVQTLRDPLTHAI
jgi:hypothetical protein